MAYFDAETYRAREAQWREQAADLAPGREQQVCLALAEGYASCSSDRRFSATPPRRQAPRTVRRPPPG
jgi:hypothetical protein